MSRREARLELQSIVSGNVKPNKADKELKRMEKLEKKKERQNMADDEMANLTAKKNPLKVTRFELELKETKIDSPKNNVTKVGAIEENLNRIMADTETASTVDEAIDVFSSSADNFSLKSARHLEKKERKAYQLFENRRLSQLKVENPKLRHSQMLDIINKEWKRSSENPLNRSS